MILSRTPFVGGIAAFFRALNTLGLKPISRPPVAALPYSFASARAVPVPLTAGISSTRSSSRLKCAEPEMPLAITRDRAVKLNGLSSAAKVRGGTC